MASTPRDLGDGDCTTSDRIGVHWSLLRLHHCLFRSYARSLSDPQPDDCQLQRLLQITFRSTTKVGVVEHHVGISIALLQFLLFPLQASAILPRGCKSDKGDTDISFSLVLSLLLSYFIFLVLKKLFDHVISLVKSL